MSLTLTGAGPPGSWNPTRLGSALKLDFAVARERAAGKLWQDLAKTSPAVADGDPVFLGTAPTGGDGVSPASGQRPLLRTDGAGHWWLQYDGADDVTAWVASWSGSYTIGWSGRLVAAGNFPMLVVLASNSEELRGNSTTGVPHLSSQGTTIDAALTSSVVGSDLTITAVANPTATRVDIFSSSGETGTNTISGTARTVSVIAAGARSPIVEFPANMRLYGLVVTNTALGAADRALLQSYLQRLHP